MSEFPSRLDDRQITVLDYLRVVWRHKWMIAVLVVVSALVALVIASRQPRVYESAVTLLIPRDSGAVSGGLAALALGGAQGGGSQGGPSIPGLVLGSSAPNRDVVVSVLKSRTVAEAAVDRFKLQARYGRPLRADAAQAMQAATSVTVSKEGLVVVSVEETDPLLAAQVANFLVEELERLTARFGLAEATRQRIFVTEQLEIAKRNLTRNEEALRAFQERNRAVVLQDQTRGAIDAAARMKAEMMAAEVRLQVMRDFATERDPDVQMLRRRIEEMKRQLGQMHYGFDRVPASAVDGEIGATDLGPEIVPPITRLPRLGIELMTLTRNFRIQETLVTLLLQQLEQAKISEAKDPPLIRVLDPAVPPVRHIRPQLRWAVGVAAAAALVVGLVLAGVVEYLRIGRGRAVAA